jgi:hypothetical protein
MTVPPRSVVRVLWSARPFAGTAPRRPARISSARKSVVAAAGEATRFAIPEVRYALMATNFRFAGNASDGLIYLKIVSETRPQLTFGRQRYVQTIER